MRYPEVTTELELALIGGLIQNGTHVRYAAEQVTPDLFLSPDARTIFKMMIELADKNIPVNQETIYRYTKGAHPSVSLAIVNATMQQRSVADVEYYVGAIREHARRRKFITGITVIREAIENPGADLADVVEEARKVFTVEADTRRDFAHIGSIMPSMLNELEMRWAMGHYGSSTGLRDVDKAIGGFEAGHLYVIAGRPSMGKTAFAFTICLHMAAESPVAFVSLEMPEHDILMRAIASEAVVPYSNIKHNTMSEYQRNKMAEAVKRVSGLNLYVKDKPSGLTEIRALVEAMMAGGGGVDGVFIDYLQLMKRPKGDNRDEEIGNITRGLKEICLEFGIWICLLSQLNRGVEYRTNKRPMLSDLRESGSVEQDADTVIFLYRPEYYGEEATAGKTEVIIAKNRNGATTTAEVVFMPEYIKFGSLAVGVEPPGRG